MRFSCVGAENVFVTRCSFTRSIQRSASNLRSTTIGAPSVCASDANASGPEWYSGPVVRCTEFSCSRLSSASSANTIWRSVRVRSAPLGLPVVPDV